MVGVPDQRLGEEICAWIELKDGETATAEEIRAFCKERVSKDIKERVVQLIADAIDLK